MFDGWALPGSVAEPVRVIVVPAGLEAGRPAMLAVGVPLMTLMVWLAAGLRVPRASRATRLTAKEPAVGGR